MKVKSNSDQWKATYFKQQVINGISWRLTFTATAASRPRLCCKRKPTSDPAWQDGCPLPMKLKQIWLSWKVSRLSEDEADKETSWSYLLDKGKIKAATITYYPSIDLNYRQIRVFWKPLKIPKTKEKCLNGSFGCLQVPKTEIINTKVIMDGMNKIGKFNSNNDNIYRSNLHHRSCQ